MAAASSSAVVISSDRIQLVSTGAAAPRVPGRRFGARSLRCQAKSNETGSVAEDVRKKVESAAESVQTQRNGAPSGVREAVDKSTKVEISRGDIERHQAEDTSEQQSWLGSKPASTVPWPRPEIERRPETGDRSLGSLFAVDGAAPETINGRMAMLGFVWAVVAEKMTGLSVAEQLFNPGTSGLFYFAGVVQLFTLASVIPFVNGESTDARRWGPFNARAERWNGRLAMIGFAALVVDEFFRQAPLFAGHMRLRQALNSNPPYC